MRYLLTFLLFGIVIAGCSTQSSASEARRDIPSDNPNIADVAPEGRLTEVTPSKDPDSSLPVMTVNPPPILLTPIQGDATEAPMDENSAPPANWQTFTSSTLGVALNYPADWSAAEESKSVTFTSPSGATIELKTDVANIDNKEFKIGNQYCTSRTNEHGQIADICVDQAAFTYTAKFSLQEANGSTHWVTLLTQTRSAGEVFEKMFNSLRPAN